MHRNNASNDSNDIMRVEHLDLWVNYIETACKSTTERLLPLLKRNEIAYNLAPNLVQNELRGLTHCRGIGVVRCLIYNHGEEKK